MQRGGVSFWYQELGGLPKPHPALDRSVSADICIIGAGYTGLWAAYYLKKADPSLNIVIVEEHFAGFGASGRNGGWLSGNFAWEHEKYLSSGTAEQVKAMVEAFHGTVDEVIAAAEMEGINADIHRTQELAIATNAYQFQRLAPELKRLHHWGDHRSRFESEAQVRARIAIPSAKGALVTSGVARVQPAKLVRGLADAVARLGVTIYEATRAHEISKGQVITHKGRVACAVVLKATEGYSA
ncbi:FAD-dependent oxidoreductase, partial [Planktomarina temperata]|nr:FAD-dependent oxidoreductase [Planktomarina temperata]